MHKNKSFNNKNKLLRKLLAIDNIGVLMLSFALFMVLVFYLSRSDIRIHAFHVKQINMGMADYPPTILLYFAINLFSFFSTSTGILYLATVCILALAVTTKYIITKIIIQEFTLNSLSIVKWSNYIIPITAFCLLFIFTIPDYYNVFVLKNYYLGRVVPNTWHNSTIIFLMPFALLLFWQQYKILTSFNASGQRKQIFTLTLLIIINLLIKPSFFFVYAPVTVIFLLIKFGTSRSFINYSIPIVIGFLILIAQYLIIYIFQYGYLSEGGSQVAISKPFEIWSEYVPGWYIPISLLISFSLPILYYLFFINNFRKFKIIDTYAISLTIVGLLISAFVLEEGPRRLHGNFFWQNVVCSYIISLIVAMHILNKIPNMGLRNWKIKLLISVFFLQFFSGILYIVHIISKNTYY